MTTGQSAWKPAYYKQAWKIWLMTHTKTDKLAFWTDIMQIWNSVIVVKYYLNCLYHFYFFPSISTPMISSGRRTMKKTIHFLFWEPWVWLVSWLWEQWMECPCSDYEGREWGAGSKMMGLDSLVTHADWDHGWWPGQWMGTKDDNEHSPEGKVTTSDLKTPKVEYECSKHLKVWDCDIWGDI